ncbi:low-affinity phosphate transporter [Rhizophlyctis rosea]|nr:low-affinity phosphate transporter [Rhizophlyctis rosea]
MKFSHSIQLNSSPEWTEYYLAYSQLKKIIYAIEKATLGLQSLPASPHDIETGEADAESGRNRRSEESEIRDEERAPLIHQPLDQEEANAYFTRALDEQLEKISHFYRRKEQDLLAEVEAIGVDINYIETHDGAWLLAQTALPANFDTLGRASGGAASAASGDSPRRPQSVYEDHVAPSSRPTRPRRSVSEPQNPHEDERHRYMASVIWGSKGLKQHRQRFHKRLSDAFVLLCELKDYVELNYTGFSKIVKKYDKVTGNKLRRTYLANKVEPAYPFRTETKQRLDEAVDRIVEQYARVLTDGKQSLALTDLKSNLREHIVWERNTIWRDMIEQERRRETIGLRPLKKAADEATKREVIFLGLKFTVPKLSTKLMLFVLCSTVFGFLLTADTFEIPEQRNCLAILVFVSLLWAFEVLQLFVTALFVPFLVVLLRVLREPVVQRDGSIEYHRMDAKAASKRIFSDMFGSVIMLLLGGFALASALSKHNIAKGVASFVLGKAGSKPHMVLLALMFVSTFASMWISNVAAPVLCFSLITPILRNLPHKSPYARCLIMGIAMASNVGGMASPIASPQNIIAMGTIDPPPSWLDWFTIALPVVVTIDLMIWGLLLAVYRPKETEGTAPPEIFSRSHFKDHPLTKTQVYILLVSALTIGLWCAESKLEGWVGDMGIIAIVPIVAFFGTGILTKDDWNSMLWSVVMLAMGGIALGKAVESSGLLHEITGSIAPHLTNLSTFHCLAIFSGIVLLVTSFISHTVGALIILPIVVQVAHTLPDPRPRTMVMAAALMCSGAMGLPVSSFPNMNAISLEDATGIPWLSVKDFLVAGIPSGFIAWGAIMSIGYFIMGLLDFR